MHSPKEWASINLDGREFFHRELFGESVYFCVEECEFEIIEINIPDGIKKQSSGRDKV